jgi:uncharacterized membrane protein
MLTTKKIAAVIAALALAGVTAPAAIAGPPDPAPKGKCNSGNGNNSETDPANDCDPGNSGGHNNGGD